MNTMLAVIGASVICLLLVGAILVVTILLILRKSRETFSDPAIGNAPVGDSAERTSTANTDTRYSRSNLKTTSSSTPPAAEASLACPACGAPNPRSARVCASCSSKLK